MCSDPGMIADGRSRPIDPEGDARGVVPQGGLECGCGDGGVVAFFRAAAEDAVRGFSDHFSEEQPEVRALAVVGGGDVFHAAGVCRELETFPE